MLEGEFGFSNNNNNNSDNERISRALFPCETCSIALNRCKYKSRKCVQIRQSKAVGVQTIMLKHPIKHKKEHP